MWYKWNGTLCVEKEVMHLCAVSGSLALAHGGVCTVFDLSCASKTLKQSLIQSGCITSYLLCVSLSLLTYIFIFILQTCPCQLIYLYMLFLIIKLHRHSNICFSILFIFDFLHFCLIVLYICIHCILYCCLCVCLVLCYIWSYDHEIQ